MRLGQAAMEALRAEITGCLKPGDELVVACPVALKGTSVIAKNKKDKLAERFSAGFIQNCVSLWDAYGAGSIVWKIAQEADASALYAMGEGGFLSEAVSKIFKKFRWLISQPDGKENKNGSE